MIEFSSVSRAFVLGLLLILAPSLLAQDVAERGVRHGAKLPDWMQARLEADPNAFEFRRALLSALDRAKVQRTRLALEGLDTDSLSPARASALKAVVGGVLRVPVLPILYSNTVNAPFSPASLQQKYFSPRPDVLSVSTLYREMSRGALQVTGTVFNWSRVSRADAYYEGEDNGAPPGLGELLTEVLDLADRTVNFRQFDRDGDGYVDVVAFVHPESGGECSNRNLWSMRWTFGSATGRGLAYRTNDGVLISDFVVLPALDCDQRMTGIGVAAHELGHALGLPDLYSTATPAANGGLSYWSLMSHGDWNTESSPAHLDAWSKSELGWLQVRTVDGSVQDVSLPPVIHDGHAVRINLPDSPGEYFLLENRRALSSDQHLLGEGLLIWHVDSAQIRTKSRLNTVQNDNARPGVRLVQADGADHLRRPGGLADAGDIFPGSANVTRIDSRTNPNTRGYRGARGEIAIFDITERADTVLFSVEIAAAPPVAGGRAPASVQKDAVFREAADKGPFAVVQFRQALAAQDTAWLSQNGFTIHDTFERSGAVLVSLPANASEALTRQNSRILKVDVQQRSRP